MGGNAPHSWLCRTEAQRERIVDMERRLGRPRAISFVVLAVALLANDPWIGWWTLVPMTLAGVGFVVAGGGVPIIFLTARDAGEDKLRGLTMGGDDYVTKPFSLEELVARIRNLLRRTGLAAPETSTLAFEDLMLDEDTREVSRAGEPVELTATEYRLLRYLMLNPRRVLTREQILNHVWDYDFGGDARVLETYVSYLRKKLDRNGPSLIHTSRGVGYALRVPRTR